MGVTLLDWKSLLVLVAVAAMTPTASYAAGGGPSVFTVGGVSAGDSLNVRRKPKSSSMVVGTMKNGDQGFVDTANCWNSATGKRIPQAKVNFAKPNTWCSVMGGADGELVGFVRAKFLH